MNSFQIPELLVSYLTFAAVHVGITFYLLTRIKHTYPNLWTRLGSPQFATFEGDPKSVFSLRVVRFIYFTSWGKEITDTRILLLRNILRGSALIGFACFMFLLILISLSRV